MSVDVDRAVAFVRTHGDEFDRARLDAVLEEGSLLSREQKQRLLAGQRDDGGWPAFWASNYSSLDATCFRLAQGEGMGIDPWCPAFVQAVGFLRPQPRQEGSSGKGAAGRGAADGL